MDRTWTIAVDRGGTFTDLVAISSDGIIHTDKILSHARQYDNAILFAIEKIVSKYPKINDVRVGTTVATNALLERKGNATCFVTTLGFEDILEIGYQDRSDLFACNILKKKSLYHRVIGVTERINANGEVIAPVDKEKLVQELQKVDKKTSLAIAFHNSWRNPEHEKEVEILALNLGFKHVFCSYHICPVIKLVMRGHTTVLHSYLHPKVQQHNKNLKEYLDPIPLSFMQSNGGITNNLLGKDAILSGPAGGIIAVEHVAKKLGYGCAISFDMGGTSTDVARYDGTIDRLFENQIVGMPFHSDMLHIKTIAAGGGSLLLFDGEKLQVGPESAGAYPGPCSYGLGGNLTVTDANLLLGRLMPEYFPKVFGEDGKQCLDRCTVEKKFIELSQRINKKCGTSMSCEELAQGFIRVANENMSQAIKEISITQGFSLDDYILACFGGAGGQHACAIARTLNIPKILLHPTSGVFSAYGIALAENTKTAAKSVLVSFTNKNFSILLRDFLALESDFNQDEASVVSRFLDIRVRGADHYLTIPKTSFEQTYQNYVEKYSQHYGISLQENDLEIVNIRSEIRQEKQIFCEKKQLNEYKQQPQVEKQQKVFYEGKWITFSVFLREQLSPGTNIKGPIIIIDPYSTILVEPGFTAQINEYNHIILELEDTVLRTVEVKKDPVWLEIINNSFVHVAEQMGYTLAKTAHSTNIKERLDFSCALFDCTGNLVANAPHIPVHLGAMSDTVKALISSGIELTPQDVYISNDPFNGGSHLPDITAISTFFYQEKIAFFVACRGHHADIGGISPGSMPAFSKNIGEEGILIHNFQLVKKGVMQTEKLLQLLQKNLYPARNLDERLSDLRAQIAANQKGLTELAMLIERYGYQTIDNYTCYVQKNASNAVEKWIKERLGSANQKTYYYRDFLDNGACIKVSIYLKKVNDIYQGVIDFTGTSPEDNGNLNAPNAVVKSAILYVLRTLIRERIPLNSGCLEPFKIVIPQDSILSPSVGAAVVGGNVETSQRVVDVLYGALQVVAASQGTMNNFTFGQEGENGFGYYETICGGAGAGPNFDGAHAVHTHMTNTRITDPEILEYRYPQVMLKEFSIRKNSGGKGKYNGGNGVIRKIQFLESCNVSILSERRSTQPYGVKGGKNGKRGKNTITNIDGVEQILPGKVNLEVQKGEIVTIYTPGGGGYGLS